MFNNVVLDVAMGIIFIFLVYSLLATSIQEAIATAFAMRARTLRDGIINGMLSNTKPTSRWESIGTGVLCFFQNIWYMIVGKPEVKDKNLGQLFYDHPIIKNYGSSAIFPNPSYLPSTNFSTILIDVLKEDFDDKINDIAQYKFTTQTGTTSLADITQSLQNSSDAVKIKELIGFYGYYYSKNSTATPPAGLNLIIDKDTWQILQLHLRNSLYSIEEFTKKLETWYDDSMNRVSGWYKRQVQTILFIIGIVLAVTFNVDVLQIAGKLSTDKDARDQLVQLAIKQADNLKNDPRVTGTPVKGKPDSSKSDSLLNAYHQQIAEAKKTIDTSVVKANTILALGWGDYGKKIDSAKIVTNYLKSKDKDFNVKIDSAKIELTAIDRFARHKIDSLRKDDTTKTANLKVVHPKTDTTKQTREKLKTDIGKVHYQFRIDTGKIRTQARVDSGKILRKIVDKNYTKWDGFWYVIGQAFTLNKLLGFLITAFAISLGAPFWFDALNKLVSLRASGKKEDSSTGSNAKAAPSAQQPPVTVNVSPQQTGEEAVG
jgi:hypothetical protein